MKEFPLGAMVDVWFSQDTSAFQYGYYLGDWNGTHRIIYCLDTCMEHPIAHYKQEFFEIHNSRGAKPKTLTAGQRLLHSLGRKLPVEALYEPTEWPVDIQMAAPEDWTNNFAAGEKIYITCRGKRERVTVVTCFRDYVAFRWPVGSLDCRHASECSTEHGDTNADRMSRVHDLALKWAQDPNSTPEKSAAAVTAIRKALK